jgi:hypothetical protein
MAWLFGDSFDHYTDLTTKYDAVGTAQSIGIGVGRFGTNCCRFTQAGGSLRKTLPGAAADAFATMAFSLQRTATGRCGVLNLWSGTRGHVVVAREDNGSITVRRQTGNEAPLASGGPIIAQTAPGVWPVGSYTSLEIGIVLSATNGVIRLRVNGDELITATNVATANPNASGWTGWYVGLETSIGILDLDDLMFYTDQNVGDGVQDFLGDLTGEVVVPAASVQEAWTRNTGLTNWGCVNELPPDNDATYVEAGVLSLGDYYRMTPLTRVTQGIRAVQIVITARKTGSPPRSIAGLLIDNNVGYVGPAIPLAVGYQAAIVPRPLASWGGYWTMDQVNAALVGMELVL